MLGADGASVVEGETDGCVVVVGAWVVPVGGTPADPPGLLGVVPGVKGGWEVVVVDGAVVVVVGGEVVVVVEGRGGTVVVVVGTGAGVRADPPGPLGVAPGVKGGCVVVGGTGGPSGPKTSGPTTARLRGPKLRGCGSAGGIGVCAEVPGPPSGGLTTWEYKPGILSFPKNTVSYTIR